MPGREAMNERFKTLVRHFFSRFFDTESMSADADERANVVQIIAMLAVPGALISLFTIANHPLIRSEVTRQLLRAGDHYVFVSYSMVVMGFVMTFKWDSLFPDRRDYLILTPLPVSLRDVARLRNVRVRVTMAPQSGGGSFEMRLFVDEAPATVARFTASARRGYYNGLTFHREATNFKRSERRAAPKPDRPCRPRRCETQRLLLPSMPARAGMEPRQSAPSGGRPPYPSDEGLH